MKNFTDKIKNIFKKPTKSVSPRMLPNPHRHWKMLLWVFFVIVLILIIFSLYLLYEIKNDQVFQATPAFEENTNLLREDLFKTTTDLFDQKANTEGELKSNPPSYRDPSI